MAGMTSPDPAGIGVLLVNLGTPDAATPKAVRRYLAEFLSDPRVVEIPQIAWQPILRGIVLTVRPKKSAHAYSQVWTPEGSPLAAVTKAQARALQERMPQVRVDYAMRYGNPALGDAVQRMMDAGCTRILLAPLYPQYCAATTATVVDKIGDKLRTMRWQPTLRTLPPYFDDAQHIAALAQDIGRQLDALPFVPEVLLLSFHGMPVRTKLKGDPYHDQCLATARLLEAALDRPNLRCVATFQSRFGAEKWLEPATEDVLGQEAKAGTKALAVAAPGFSADCVETLEELGIRGREVFTEAGGQHYQVLECLNAGEAGMAMLEALVRRELSGWV